MKILIAYDGSECAERALFDLKKAGLPLHTKAFVLSLADVWLPPKGPVDPGLPEWFASNLKEKNKKLLKMLEDARKLATKAGRRLRAQFPEWRIMTEACADSPAWGILKKADKWKPDLIIVGSHGRDVLGRLVIGSASQKVLTHAERSVRIARGPAKESAAPPRIVLGVDGSPEAVRAVRSVASRKWAKGTAVRLVTVVDDKIAIAVAYPRGAIKPWFRKTDKDPQNWIKRMLQNSEAILRNKGLLVSSLIKEGNPKKVLIIEAVRWKADCIFLGARGLSAFDRFILGSVSTAVAARAHCSVEVVR